MIEKIPAPANSNLTREERLKEARNKWVGPWKDWNAVNVHDLATHRRLKSDFENLKLALQDARDAASALLGVYASRENPDEKTLQNARYIDDKLLQIEALQANATEIDGMLQPAGHIDEVFIANFFQRMDEVLGNLEAAPATDGS